MTLIALLILPVSLVLVLIVVKFSQKYFKAQQAIPVSYTHLAVYKRQPLHWTSWWPPATSTIWSSPLAR